MLGRVDGDRRDGRPHLGRHVVQAGLQQRRDDRSSVACLAGHVDDEPPVSVTVPQPSCSTIRRTAATIRARCSGPGGVTGPANWRMASSSWSPRRRVMAKYVEAISRAAMPGGGIRVDADVERGSVAHVDEHPGQLLDGDPLDGDAVGQLQDHRQQFGIQARDVLVRGGDRRPDLGVVEADGGAEPHVGVVPAGLPRCRRLDAVADDLRQPVDEVPVRYPRPRRSAR